MQAYITLNGLFQHPQSSQATQGRSLPTPCSLRRRQEARRHTALSALGSASEREAAHTRRESLLASAALLGAACLSRPATAAPGGAGDAAPAKLLCDEECLAKVEASAKASTASGLEYIDVVVGTGPTPPIGYQVVVDYVAMTPQGKVFDSSLDRGAPYDVRVGSGQIVAGLDEGIKSMKVGGLRRLYIPGKLSFPKGVPSAVGRPRVPPASPVVFDVKLLYIPGLSDDE